MSTYPNNKEAWLRMLKQTAIPSLDASIQALDKAQEYSTSHSSELARIILQDPSLTASVLKLANSAQFNRRNQTVRTISRALMIVGHKSIKEVCASCLLMDQFLKNGASECIQLLLARAFHAAVQAKEIAMMKHMKGVEEIFISSLLLNLGEIAVYSAVEPSSKLALGLTENYPFSLGKEKDLLGCYFHDLTLGLCESWHIAPMIGEMLAGNYDEDSKLRCILLGNSIAAKAEIGGLEVATNSLLKPLTRYTKRSAEEIVKHLENASELTAKSLALFGLYLNRDQKLSSLQGGVSEQTKLVIDKELLLDVILELTLAAQEKIEINYFLQTLLEGIHRGAGFQVSLVALSNPRHTDISAKHVIELDSTSLKESFNFSCHFHIPEVKQKVMVNQNVVLQSELRPQGATLKHILKITNARNAIWGPLIVEGKTIGCIYANNGVNGPPINQQQLDAFKFFVIQARVLLYKLK